MAEQMRMATAFHLRNAEGEQLHLIDVIDQVTSFVIAEVYVADMTVHIVMQVAIPEPSHELTGYIEELNR